MLDQKYIDNLIKLRDWLLENKDVVQKHLDFKTFIETNPTEELQSHSNLSLALFDLEHGLGKDIHIPLLYFKSEHCNTTCCLAGWAGISRLFDSEDDDTWIDFLYRNFGVVHDDYNIGNYIFGGHHLPILDDAIERINYVIQNSTHPEDYIPVSPF